MDDLSKGNKLMFAAGLLEDTYRGRSKAQEQVVAQLADMQLWASKLE